MNDKPSLVLFDDDEKEGILILASLRKKFRNRANVDPFTLGQGNRSKTFESLLINDLQPILGNLRMILCDQDLSSMKGFQGLSGEVVTTVAREEGLSIALYGRGQSDIMADRVKQRRKFLERRFFIEFGDKYQLDVFSESVLGIFQGCEEIYQFINKHVFNGFEGKMQPKSGNPSSLMSKLLGRKEIQTRLSLYSSGDQQYLEALTTVDSIKDPEKACRIISSELSYWLWESILRFPGILLNGIAAASFLNIEKQQFEKPDVQQLFKTALYKGPFGKISSRWWRDDLQQILDRKGVGSGLELARSSGIKGIKRCKCVVDPQVDAGYYCMLSNQPVSLKNSIGKIPYFPPGADLARISKTEFEKVAPWAGLEA